MILTVGMSPCIDVTARLDKFRLGKTNVAGEKTVTYAGKANNVAVGIARLGERRLLRALCITKTALYLKRRWIKKEFLSALYGIPGACARTINLSIKAAYSPK